MSCLPAPLRVSNCRLGLPSAQHGITRMTGLSPRITAILPGEVKLVVTAKEEGEPGHYSASLTFPKAGEWQWAIEAFTMYQPMPAFTVTADKTAAVSPPGRETTPASLLNSPILPISAAMITLGLFAAVIGFRRRSRPLRVSTVLSLLAGIALLALPSPQYYDRMYKMIGLYLKSRFILGTSSPVWSGAVRSMKGLRDYMAPFCGTAMVFDDYPDMLQLSDIIPIYPWGDFNTLFNIVQHFKSNTEEYNILINKQREWVENHTIEKYIENILTQEGII